MSFKFYTAKSCAKGLKSCLSKFIAAISSKPMECKERRLKGRLAFPHIGVSKKIEETDFGRQRSNEYESQGAVLQPPLCKTIFSCRAGVFVFDGTCRQPFSAGFSLAVNTAPSAAAPMLQ